MNPIYRSMTGEIQCTIEDGVLHVREWPEREGPGPWLLRPNYTPETAKAENRIAFALPKGDERKKLMYRSACIYCCLMDDRKSCYYVEYRSIGIQRKLDELSEALSKAIAAEIADRPHLPCEVAP